MLSCTTAYWKFRTYCLSLPTVSWLGFAAAFLAGCVFQSSEEFSVGTARFNEETGFVEGLPPYTRNEAMPTTGTASYEGRYSYSTSSGVGDGSASMAINFGSFEMVYRMRGDIDARIDGYVSGNGVAGNNSGYQFNGAFFGNEYEYVSGTFGGLLFGAGGGFVDGRYILKR